MNFARRAPGDARRLSQSQDDLATIGDMARAFGVSLRALRFYEDKGLLAPLRQGAARLYSARDKGRLQAILKAKSLGFTLGEIRDMAARGQLQEAEASREAGITLPPGQILAQIDHLERQRRDLDSAIAQLRATHARLAGDDMRASHVG